MNKVIEYGLLSVASIIGAAFFFVLAWLPAILCVAAGYGPDVCGM